MHFKIKLYIKKIDHELKKHGGIFSVVLKIKKKILLILVKSKSSFQHTTPYSTLQSKIINTKSPTSFLKLSAIMGYKNYN